MEEINAKSTSRSPSNLAYQRGHPHTKLVSELSLATAIVGVWRMCQHPAAIKVADVNIASGGRGGKNKRQTRFCAETQLKSWHSAIQ